MKKWDFIINGTQLNEVIKEGNSIETLKTLYLELKKFIYNHVDIENYTDMYLDFEYLLELLETDVEKTKEELEYDIFMTCSDKTLSDYVNERLLRFKDLCDKWRVFVNI